MRALLLATVLLLSAACGKVGTSVKVTLDASPMLSGITRLHLEMTNGSTTREVDVTPPAASIPPAIDLAIHVPPTAKGTLTVKVTAFANATELGSAQKDVELEPGSIVSMTLTLSKDPPQDLGADGRSADLAMSDLGIESDLGSDPDLAEPGPDLQTQDLAPLALPLVAVPASHDFMNVDEDTASTTFTFTIQNQTTMSTGTAPVVEIVGPDAAQFSFTTTCNLSLGQDGTCMVTVTFNPDGAGLRNATLYVHTSTHAITAPLTGLAIGKNGAACANDDTHCQSGNCVDGFCCDMTAAQCGGCKACNVATKEGTCSSVPVDTDPKGNCTTGCFDKCNGAGACKPVLDGQDPHNFCTDVCMDKCNGAGACKPAPSTKACGSVPCSNSGSGHTQFQGTSSGALTCSGSNFNCVAGATCPGALSCDPGTGTCRSSCGNDMECLYRTKCDGPSCSASNVSLGGACTSDEQCSSNMNTGDDHMRCLDGKCQNCITNRDCTPGFFCKLDTGLNVKACFDCSNDGDCSATAGWGGTCKGNGRCNCASAADCDPRAPYCINGGANRNLCGCNFDGQRCNNDETCVGSTPGNSTCKFKPGTTCTSPAQCASTSCVQGRCQ